MYTAEFVSPMHPDKICDRISGSILDECLKQDPNSRVAIETMGGHKKIVVMGELTTNAKLDIEEIVKNEINDSSFEVITNISKQSNEISRGVDIGGAGDQGIMVGYACKENELLIPMEYVLARSLCEYIYSRYPVDGKTQITLEGKKIKTILVSWSGISKERIFELIKGWMFRRPQTECTKDREILINPAGDWNQSGFDSDTGLTGRKIVIDAYGPRIPVGGGAFSGKDPTKVDLSGALMARKIAVETLKNTNSYEVLVQVAYAIGKANPIQIDIKVDGQEIEISKELINRFVPNNIMEELDLRKPQYKKLSMWGHFGNSNIWDQ